MADDDWKRYLYRDGFALEQQIGPWSVLMEWPSGAEEGGPQRIDIRPAVPETAAPEPGFTERVKGGLSSTVLRQINFTETYGFVDAARELNSGLTAASAAPRLRQLAGESGVSDVYLAHLAQMYVLLVRAGEKSVTAKLAKMVDKSPETIRQHLKRVRKAGLLTTIPGKAGGRLTDKAHEILGR